MVIHPQIPVLSMVVWRPLRAAATPRTQPHLAHPGKEGGQPSCRALGEGAVGHKGSGQSLEPACQVSHGGQTRVAERNWRRAAHYAQQTGERGGGTRWGWKKFTPAPLQL